MDVVIARALNDQELCLQLSCKCPRRTLFVFVRVVLRQSTIALLINRVVITYVRDRCDSNSNAIEIRIAEHRVQGRRAAPAPSPYSYPRWIYKRPLGNGPCGAGLIP